MSKVEHWSIRTRQFCDRMGLDVPIFLAPMAGACPVELSVAVANRGGLGACGVLLMKPDAILQWADEFRAKSSGVFQMNNWIPDPEPNRDTAHEQRIQSFISRWQASEIVDTQSPDPPNFKAQCEAMLEARPRAISSIMGIYSESFVERMKRHGIFWLATATTVGEATQAQAAGADAIVAQGFEAGGHRGTFVASMAQNASAGLFALLPAIVDAVSVPVIATGAIADGRGIAAALTLGASAVQIGTGYLRTPEAAIPSVWADAIGCAKPDDTMLTRAFTGRLGRSIATEYVKATESVDAPLPAPYPVQRQLTSPLTAAARRNNDLTTMQAWSGQAGQLATVQPAGQLTTTLWNDTKKLMH